MARFTMPSFATIRAFEAVGRTGGIRKAAKELGVSHPIISRHLATLENHVGVILINRATGQLTPNGRRYHARISTAILQLEDATREIARQPTGTLIISCSAGLSLHWLASRLSHFQNLESRRHGAVIELRSTDATASLASEDADGDIRYFLDGRLPTVAPRIRFEELARPDIFPVASPALLARLGDKLRHKADIIRFPLIQEGDDEEWRTWLGTQGVTGVCLPPPAGRYGQAHLTLAAARAGQGIALTNKLLVRDDLSAGRLALVAPSPEFWGPARIGAYYFGAGRLKWNDPLIARFRKWLRNEVANEDADT
jgi:DNA-binding transcriptional LysR family regulator